MTMPSLNVDPNMQYEPSVHGSITPSFDIDSITYTEEEIDRLFAESGIFTEPGSDNTGLPTDIFPDLDGSTEPTPQQRSEADNILSILEEYAGYQFDSEIEGSAILPYNSSSEERESKRLRYSTPTTELQIKEIPEPQSTQQLLSSEHTTPIQPSESEKDSCNTPPPPITTWDALTSMYADVVCEDE